MDLRELQRAKREEDRRITLDKLEVGALIRTELTEDEGLIFKNGRHSKPKRLVIVGIDKENKVFFGSVLVNTKLNPRARFSEEYLRTQYLLSQSNYPEFLKYDSYVDCGDLLAIPFPRLERGEFFGQLLEEDKRMILDLLETTDTISTKIKKRFGIKRR
jgi:hypothetical protein